MANTTRQFGQTIQIKTENRETRKKNNKDWFLHLDYRPLKGWYRHPPSPEYLYLEYWYPTEWNALLHCYIIRYVLMI